MTDAKHAGKPVYSDGHPLDEVHYREFKILLKPDHFTQAHQFKEFGKLLRHASAELDVALYTDKVLSQENQVREVVFYDTHHFDLYNHAFILRKRTLYKNGFATGAPELALKFRHADLEAAAAVDVRPQAPGTSRIKFKEEILPLTDRLGGARSLYSHNVVLTLTQATIDPSVKHIAQTFPCLQRVDLQGRTLALVNNVAVEEILHDLGELHFGHGVQGDANVGVWRRRADQKPLIGEFAFQCKFKRADELHDKASRHADKFFIGLQHAVRDWVQLGTTKTRVVYGMGTTEIRNRE
ncbi:MAG TPA: hypothetical protein VL049_12070 [Candidatus Dormibacteraeota bacterium]|nr:hypothetical protein [Candidatus Dormibacteraeota bacterium]